MKASDFINTTTGAPSLSELDDVSVGTQTTNQVLGWNGTKWIPMNPLLKKLDDIEDVNTPSPSANQVLTWDGSKWTSKTPTSGTTINKLDDIGDVNVGSPIDGQALVFDSVMQAWKAGTVAGGSSSNTDVSQLGSWVLVDKRSFTNAAPNYTLNCDGNSWEKVRVCVNAHNAGVSPLFLRLNDVKSGYRYAYSQGGNSGEAGVAVISGIIIATDSNTTTSVTEVELRSAGSGRMATGVLSFGITGYTNYIQTQGIRLESPQENITSLVVCSDGSLITGTVEIYKWQTINPIELHSYELVREITLNNQEVDLNIPWNYVNEELIIQSNLKCEANPSNVYLYFNGDLAANYYFIYNSNGSVGNVPYPPEVCATGSVGGESKFTIHCNLKKGLARKYYSNELRKEGNSFWNNTYGGYWSNTTDDVSSIQLKANTGTRFTGTIRLYTIAKTHLYCQNPGLLNGMSLSCSDGSSVIIKPGEIEINGVVCNQTKQISITLASNLRSGETKTNSTLYYVYAIKDVARNISFKFSNIAPLLDRFGNVAASLEECDNKCAWYHPNEGLNWRWIGQVFVNSSGNIVSFDKCRPGYWESTWTQVPNGYQYVNVNHALGKIPKDFKLWAKQSLTDTGWLKTRSQDSVGISSNTGGYIGPENDYMTGTSLKIWMNSNYWIYKNDAWVNGGYFKIILES